ncbi:MAG: VCBS repeat-containing protein [Candidatus Heimdallarchaeota archaeon]|nr:VCBS repeat-containing protein [Candidatus Heimdallarchaeota archaeon]
MKRKLIAFLFCWSIILITYSNVSSNDFAQNQEIAPLETNDSIIEKGALSYYAPKLEGEEGGLNLDMFLWDYDMDGEEEILLISQNNIRLIKSNIDGLDILQTWSSFEFGKGSGVVNIDDDEAKEILIPSTFRANPENIQIYCNNTLPCYNDYTSGFLILNPENGSITSTFLEFSDIPYSYYITGSSTGVIDDNIFYSMVNSMQGEITVFSIKKTPFLITLETIIYFDQPVNLVFADTNNDNTTELVIAGKNVVNIYSYATGYFVGIEIVFYSPNVNVRIELEFIDDYISKKIIIIGHDSITKEYFLEAWFSNGTRSIIHQANMIHNPIFALNELQITSGNYWNSDMPQLVLINRNGYRPLIYNITTSSWEETLLPNQGTNLSIDNGNIRNYILKTKGATKNGSKLIYCPLETHTFIARFSNVTNQYSSYNYFLGNMVTSSFAYEISSQLVVDVNNDLKKDIIVGYKGGHLAIYSMMNESLEKIFSHQIGTGSDSGRSYTSVTSMNFNGSTYIVASYHNKINIFLYNSSSGDFEIIYDEYAHSLLLPSGSYSIVSILNFEFNDALGDEIGIVTWEAGQSKVYVTKFNGTILTVLTKITLTGNPDFRFSEVTSLSYDYDGDGNQDLALTGDSTGNEPPNTSKVWILRNINGTIPSLAEVYISEAKNSQRFHNTLAAVDIDNNGKEELIFMTNGNEEETTEFHIRWNGDSFIQNPLTWQHRKGSDLSMDFRYIGNSSYGQLFYSSQTQGGNKIWRINSSDLSDITIEEIGLSIRGYTSYSSIPSPVIIGSDLEGNPLFFGNSGHASIFGLVTGSYSFAQNENQITYISSTNSREVYTSFQTRVLSQMSLFSNLNGMIYQNGTHTIQNLTSTLIVQSIEITISMGWPSGLDVYLYLNPYGSTSSTGSTTNNPDTSSSSVTPSHTSQSTISSSAFSTPPTQSSSSSNTETSSSQSPQVNYSSFFLIFTSIIFVGVFHKRK